MEYRYLANTGEHPHCIWIDNSKPSARLSRHTGSMGQGELDGFLRNTYRGDLLLSDELQKWLDYATPDAYKLNGHSRTGMAILFRRKGDAMLFKLTHGGA